MADPAPVRLDGFEDLTRAEGKLLIECEGRIRRTIDQAGKKAGPDFRTIKDQRLYKASHSSWESYCLDVWGWSERTCNRMIQVAAEQELAAARELDSGEERPAQRQARASDSPPPSQREASRRQAARRRGEDPGPLPSEADRIAGASMKAAARKPQPARPTGAATHTPAPSTGISAHTGLPTANKDQRRRQIASRMVKVFDEATKLPAVEAGQVMAGEPGGVLRAKAFQRWACDMYAAALEREAAKVGGSR